MFTTSTLDTARKLVIGNAVSDALDADRPTALTPATRARGEALVNASTRLRFFSDLSPQRVDQATDTVLTSFRAHLEDGERVLRDSVVPLGDPQREAKGRLRFLQTQLFPKGTGYTKLTMDLQWGELLALRAAMHEPEVVAALQAQGMDALAAHLLDHIALYGRMLGKEAGSARAGEEEATASWGDAMRMFAAQVLLDYENDGALRQELLGTYEAQLEQQRSVYRTRNVPKAGGGGDKPPTKTPGGSEKAAARAARGAREATPQAAGDAGAVGAADRVSPEVIAQAPAGNAAPAAV